MDEREFKSEFPELIRRFANYKEVVQRCSTKTVTEYLFDLRTFSKYLLAERNSLPIEGEEFEGTITSVSSEASGGSSSEKYPVEITFNKTDDMR